MSDYKQTRDISGRVTSQYGQMLQNLSDDDDLKRRLRDVAEFEGLRVAEEAADRIEELEAELHLMKTSGVVEVAVRNPSVMEYIKHWESRAETAEDKLAKAVEGLAWCSIYENSERATATLAELKGEK